MLATRSGCKVPDGTLGGCLEELEMLP